MVADAAARRLRKQPAQGKHAPGRAYANLWAKRRQEPLESELPDFESAPRAIDGSNLGEGPAPVPAPVREPYAPDLDPYAPDREPRAFATPATGFSTPAPWATAPPAPPPPAADRARPTGAAGKTGEAVFDLRPLSTGEILDRTFSLFRRNFWLFTGISAVSAAVLAVGTLVRLTTNPAIAALATLGTPGASTSLPTAALGSALVSLGANVIFLVAYYLTHAATMAAVSSIYLGSRISIGEAFRGVRTFWLRYLLIAWWQTWSILWLPLLILCLAVAPLTLPASGGYGVIVGLFALLAVLSFGYGFYAYMRNSLAIVASVVEGLKVKASLARSKVLTHHRILRVLALMLLLVVLGFAASAAQGIPAFLLLMAARNAEHTGQIFAGGLLLIMTFAASALITPIGSIAFCLFYIDERVRREGFDIETLLDRGASFAPGFTAAAAESPFSTPGLG